MYELHQIFQCLTRVCNTSTDTAFEHLGTRSTFGLSSKAIPSYPQPILFVFRHSPEAIAKLLPCDLCNALTDAPIAQEAVLRCSGTTVHRSTSASVLQIPSDMHHSKKKRMSLALREATARCATEEIMFSLVMHV